MTLSERNEASTRTELIDTQLARAGWSRNRRTLIEEFLLKATEPDRAYGNEQFADYVLLGSDGKPIVGLGVMTTIQRTHFRELGT